MCGSVMNLFLPCSLLIQDGFSEADWKEAEEAVASAKVEYVWLEFNNKSTQRQRAVHTLTAGLTRSTFVRNIRLWHVPVEMVESVRQTLSTDRRVTRVRVTSELCDQCVVSRCV